VKDSIAALDVEDAIIDREIVALDEKGRSSFQLLQGFDMGEQRPPIVFYALICCGSTERIFEICASKRERQSWKNC
jgi:hypothetical protein